MITSYLDSARLRRKDVFGIICCISLLFSSVYLTYAVDGPYNLGNLGAIGELYPPKDTPGRPTPPEEYSSIKIISIMKDTSAEKSGLVVGDLISGVGPSDFPKKSNPIHLLLTTMEDASLRKKDSSIKLRVLRNNKSLTLKAEIDYLGPHAKACPKDCPRCDKLIQQSLDYLAQHYSAGGSVPGSAVACAFCGLAFLASGSTPSSGTYRANINQCTQYLTNYFNTVNPSTVGINWALGYVTLFLGEVYHQNPTPEVKQVLQKIARMIINNQEPNGGWGYGPLGAAPLGYTDLLAATNYCVAALGIIKRLNLDVQIPEPTLKKGLDYVKGCSGSYSLTKPGRGWDRCARVAGSIFALAMFGEKESRTINALSKTSFKPRLKDLPEAHCSPLLGMLSGALACCHLEPDTWTQYLQTLYLYEVLGHRAPDGSFTARPPVMEENHDKEYGIPWTTGGYLLIMQLLKGHLTLIAGKR